MGSWAPSTVTSAILERCTVNGGLPQLTEAEEYIVPPSTHVVPEPPEGYVVSFAAFHERGFAVPADEFFRATLAYWGVELQHLTPNGVVLFSVFTALCEGWLGIPPNWELFREFIYAKIQYLPGGDRAPASIGCVAVQLRGGRTRSAFPSGDFPTANTGWRGDWFYLRDDPDRPLPRYTGRRFSETSPVWRSTPSAHMADQVARAVTRMKELVGRGLTMSHVITTWLARSVVPLRHRELRLWEMTEDRSPFVRTATAPTMTAAQVDWFVRRASRTMNRPEGAP